MAKTFNQLFNPPPKKSIIPNLNNTTHEKAYVVITILVAFILASGCKKNDQQAHTSNPTIKAVWTFKGFTDSTLAGTLTTGSINGDSLISYYLPGDSQRIDLMFNHARPLAAGTYMLNYDNPPQFPNHAGMDIYVSPHTDSFYVAPEPYQNGQQDNQPIYVAVNGTVTTITGSAIMLQSGYTTADSTTINFVITQTGL